MNIHVCQSAMTISESKNIISTVENFTSSQDSKPMIGFKLDAMSAGYLMTYGKVVVPRWLFWDVAATLDSEYVQKKIEHIKKVMEWKIDLVDLLQSEYNKNSEVKELVQKFQSAEEELSEIKSQYDKAKGKEIPPLFKKLEKAKSTVALLKQNVDSATKGMKDKLLDQLLYTGHNLFSLLLPDDFEYTIQNDKSPDGKPVFITRGVLLTGTLNKAALGSSSGSLIHHLSKDYSNQRACQFISEFCRMINVWLMQQGFSVGIYDCIATDEQLINDEVNKNLLMAKAAIESEKDPEIREANIKVALNDVTSISRSIAKKALKPDNNILKMTDLGAGAKGSSFNLTQITGMVGQTHVGTSRIEKQFGGRTLPHFEEHPTDIRTEFASRGFIFSSYYRGMKPIEKFFASAGGRQGLIDTAVKTADTGYLQRKMSKILEDLTASYIGTVNDMNQNIIQFNYGEDNFDASKLISVGKKNDKPIYSFIDINHICTRYNTDLEWKLFISSSEFQNFKKRKLSTDEKEYIKNNVIKTIYEEFYTVCFSDDCVKNAFSYLEPAIHSIEIYPEILENIYSEIKRQLKQAIVNAGESVGHVAASSMGEKNTQDSLNSVVGDTKILVMIDDSKKRNCIQTTIGELIDEECKKGFETVKYMGQNDTTKEAYAEIVNLQKDAKYKDKIYKIQSVDENGKVEWREITKLIRHPLYTKLIKVTTESGREVTATTGLSFLIKNQEGKIVPIKGSNLKVGDRIPIGYKSPKIENKFINLREWLSPNEYVYGNDLWTARIYRDKYRYKELLPHNEYKHNKNDKNPAWWNIHQNKDFILPFTRADHAMRTLEGYKSSNIGNEFYKQDCIYIKGQTVSNSHIPENIELNEIFGFFIGIYLSEGCCSDNYLSITNYDINVLNKVQELCDTWNIGWHHVEKGYKTKIANKYEENHNRIVSENSKKLEESKEPCEIRIHSKLLANWIELVCGRGSENKHIPNFAYNAPNKFIKGMLDGLFSGDGTIYNASIDYYSCSKRLIDGLVTILSYFGITCTTHMYQAKTNNKNSEIIKPTYTLSITQSNNKRLAELLETLTIQYKSDKLQIFKTKKFSHNVLWSRKRCEFDKSTRRTTEPESNYCNLNEDVFMDAIISIEEISTENVKYVYDFEVPETGNFNLLNQMHVRDSFHSSGSFKANLTSGLSRLQELMNATKNPKTKSLTIYFDKSKVNVSDLATVRRLTNIHLLSRSLNDYIKSFSIEVQPTLTDIEQVWYHMFQTFVARDDISNCKYRLRLQINTSVLFLSKRTLYNIGKMIETVFIKGIQFYVICSPDHLGIIDIWIEDTLNEPSSFFTAKGYEADLLLENFVNNENKMYHLIKKIILPKLKKLHISGIENLTECFYDNKSDEWYVQTKGGKLNCLYYNPLIDHYRSISNDLWEVNGLFGVEASKRWLKEEFSQLLTVNHRHLDILVDKMTFAGSISAVSIYGLDRKVIGPLSKAVFERPVACLLTAAQKSEYDALKSISSCVATGKLGKFGTGLVDLISDNESVINNPYAEQYTSLSLQEQQFTGEELPEIEEEDEDALTIEEPIELNEEDIY